MEAQNSAAYVVPEFQLANVGTQRKRRRGAGGWLSGGRASGTGLFGTTATSSVSGGLWGLGANATKAIVTLMMTAVVSAGSWQYGLSVARANQGGKKAEAPKLFTAKEGVQYTDLSGVIKANKDIPNSIGFISGSSDGLTPEERAKKAAADDAARKAEEEANLKSQQEAAVEQPQSPASPALDANALAGVTAGGPGHKSLTAGKFGQLGGASHGGSGLSGGAGLSGGINRNFGAAPDLGQKAAGGTLTAVRNTSKPGMATAAHARVSNSKSRGFARRQLDSAFSQSRQAASSKSENASAMAAAAFDNNIGQGNVISGGGVASEAVAGTEAKAASDGGPIEAGTASCGSGSAPDSNGNCQAIATPKAKNDAPYQSLIDMVKMLMALVTVLAVAAIIFEKSIIGAGYAQAIKYGIVAIGAIILGLGAAIMSMSGGDMMIGGIVTLVGAATIGSAFLPEMFGQGDFVVRAAGTAIANAVGALAVSQASRSQLG